MGLEPEIKRLFEYEFESEIAIGINWGCKLILRLSLSELSPNWDYDSENKEDMWLEYGIGIEIVIWF